MPIPISSVDGLKISDKTARSLPGSSTALVRSVSIVVNGIVMGYIQRFNPIEGRNTTRTWELGNEDAVEIVPGGMNENIINVERVLLYYSRMMEVFDSTNGNQGNSTGQVYPMSIMDYNYPFDIHVYMKRYKSQERTPKSEIETVLFEAYMGCWFTNYSYEVKAGEDFKLIEQATIEYTYKIGSNLLRKHS